MTKLRSTRDEGLQAQIIARRALQFDGSGSACGHVRGASAIVQVGRRRLVVQDDVLALVELGADGLVCLPLPTDTDGHVSFDERLGTKALKPDLEAATVLDDGRLVLFGSGSTSQRERLYVLDGDVVQVVHVPELYDALRSALGGDVALNVEGAVVHGDGRLVLLQRGNGRGRVDAELELPVSWLVARLAGRAGLVDVAVRRWDLGELDGTRLTFTDGFADPVGGFVYLAAAEASPNVVDDGAVAGSAIGWAGPAGGSWAPITDTEGYRPAIKAEGLARGDRPDEWLVTTDADDVDAPSELLTVRLSGPWPGSVA